MPEKFLSDNIRRNISNYRKVIGLLILIIISSATFLFAGGNNFKNSQKITPQNPEIQSQLILNFLDSAQSAKENYNYDLYLSYALSALSEAEQINSSYYVTKGLKTVGDAYYYKNEFRNSITYYVQAVDAAASLNDSILTADISVELAFTYVVNGRPDSALLHTYNALKFYRDKDDYSINKSWCYRILGDIQYSLGNYNKAQVFYEQGVGVLENEIEKDSLKLRELSMQIGSVAMVLAEQKKLKEAIYYYKRSDSIALLCNAKDVVVGNKYGLSYAYIYDGSYAKAISICKEAIAYFEATNDKFYLEGCWESLGRAYVSMGQLDSAEHYLKKAEISALQNNAYEFTKEVYVLLSLLYEKKGDPEKSLSYYKLFKEQSDSLFSKNKMYQLDVLEVAHILEASEKEMKLLEESSQTLIAAQGKTNILITIALSLAVISAVLLAYLYHHKRNKSKILQKEVDKQTAELNKANVSLQVANAELQEFAHISFHDMREPVRNINSFTKLITKKGKNITPEELEEYTSIIQLNAKQMQILVYDVFEFVRIDSEEKELNTFSPDELVNDVVKLLDKNITEKSAVVSKQIDIRNIKSNRGMLSVALRNLVENAVKYNTSLNPQIHIQMHNGNDQYTWYVKDNGIGIEPQYHDRIFEMFKRLHNREVYQGSGLGLSITKKIINKMDGEIGVISEEGKGSTFWFSIPKVD
ncbi:MAG: hypothetical protein H7Y00_11925 [Fimbriimonadaceae bacterium]|nr:hypothetical protein [Chitinophagales bacterium]